MKIRFLSNNKYKIEEVEKILGPVGIKVVPVRQKIEELQTTDIEKLVLQKCTEAYKLVGHPIFVEHTGLFIDALQGLPGGLTQIFWDKLEGDRITSLFGNSGNPNVTAKTRIGFCDGKKFYQFEGEIKGKIPVAPHGPQRFQWDSIFVPKGFNQTFAELGDKKNEISMRRQALDKFAVFLKENKYVG